MLFWLMVGFLFRRRETATSATCSVSITHSAFDAEFVLSRFLIDCLLSPEMLEPCCDIDHDKSGFTSPKSSVNFDMKLIHDLADLIEEHVEAERLRQYIGAVEQSVVSNSEASEELADWIAWARIKADCIDPSVAISDAILDSPEPRSLGYYY
jgi:hypothetical protein